MTFTVAGDKASASTKLTLDISGQPSISISGQDERLSGEATAGEERAFPLVVTNTGTAPATGLSMTATPPSGWKVTFDPKDVPPVPVNGEQKVSMLVTPAAKAIAGDYVNSVRASGDGVSESAAYRITVTTSTIWGITGIVVIGAAGCLRAAALGLARHRHRGLRAPGQAGPAAWRTALAAVLGLGGLLQLVGAAAGGTDPLQPLAPFTSRGADAGVPGVLRFASVRSVAELDTALRTAGRPVMLDFYADWCVSCKEMERYTFTDPAVQKKLAGALLLKADVTADNADDRELLKRFALFGPPGTIFFDARGQEIANARLIGYQKTDRFLETLQTAGL